MMKPQHATRVEYIKFINLIIQLGRRQNNTCLLVLAREARTFTRLEDSGDELLQSDSVHRVAVRVSPEFTGVFVLLEIQTRGVSSNTSNAGEYI